MTDNHNALLGKTVKDAVSGFSGIAIAVHRQLSGNVQVGIQPKGSEGDKMPEPMFLDVHLLDPVDDGISDRVKAPDVCEIPLGSDVVDKVSGYKGRTVAETTHINGCVQVCVQAKADKDGKLPEGIVFDYKRLEKKGAGVSDASKKPVVKKPNGGPASSMKAMRRA
jgi:hypothetical protein